MKLLHCVTNNICHDNFPTDLWQNYVPPKCIACSEQRFHYDCEPEQSMSDWEFYYKCQMLAWQTIQFESYKANFYFDEPVGDTRWKPHRKNNVFHKQMENKRKQKVSKKRKNHLHFIACEIFSS